MRDYSLSVSPFKLLDITGCRIYKGVNEHCTASFKGVIENHLEEPYLTMALEGTETSITAVGAHGEETILFCGILKSFSIKKENELKIAYGELISGTCFMDHKVHIRTFQDAGLTYEDVMRVYMDAYPKGNFIMTVGQGETISDNWLIQYNETDWEFTKRIASRFNSFVVPDYHVGGVKYFFGMPQRSAPITINPAHYSIKKRVDEYVCKKNNDVPGIIERDATYYIFEDRDIYDIGDVVSLGGQSLYIFEINSNLIGREMVHTYSLKSENGFKTVKYYNAGMIGASLAANISDVKKDIVQVTVQPDENKDKAGFRWFPYSTVYSSPDGTGWYVMPEIGDEVHLYLPIENEHSGYVISSVHLETSSDRENPDYKSLKTKYLKEVLFKPDSLTFTNNTGMRIEILDKEGIKITSNKAIQIKSEEAMEISSEKATVSITAPEMISLVQGKTTVTLKDDIIISGAQSKIQ